MFLDGGLKHSYESQVRAAKSRAAAIAGTESFTEFVDVVRRESPWRFDGKIDVGRYLHLVDRHLRKFVPRLLACVGGDIRAVFDFGCGSGSGSIAIAMIFPNAHCHGVDISQAEVSIARARARLYGVEDRCRFDVISDGQALPDPSDSFDLCMCSSVLEYVTNWDARRLCVQEMGRILAPQGIIFMSVPNRLYPVESHSGKLGWNYFPNLLKARMYGSTMWEVKALARPHLFKLHRTPLYRLFTPWTIFGLRKGPA